MTSADPMPWGKYKGTPICDVPDSYKEWLCNQPGFAEKNPQLFKLFDEGDSEELSTPLERKNLDDGAALLAPMSQAFKDFWKRSYGERMRKLGELNYIAYLRVAINAWQACETAAMFKPLPKPQTPSPKMMPPPLGHIPAPKLDSVPERDGDHSDDVDDEDPPPF